MNRRNLMLGAVGTVALPLPKVAAQPAAGVDADLIRTCAEHIINLAAYNRDGGMLPNGTPDPLWAAYEQTRNAITAAKPQTLWGMLAKARAAKAEAMGVDGEEDPDSTPAAWWAWDLVNDLLAGRAGALPPAVVGGANGLMPSRHPDAELLAACAAFDVLERAYVACYGGWQAGSPEELAAEAEQERLHIAQEPLVDSMCELRAVTPEGHAARARSLALWDAELEDALPDPQGRVNWGITRSATASLRVGGYRKPGWFSRRAGKSGVR